MIEQKKLGYIARAVFGHGGYQDAQVGFGLEFRGDGWGVSWWLGAWAMKPPANAHWSADENLLKLGEAAWKLHETLTQARRHDVRELVGVPVEVTFDGNALKSWRVLKEVLP